MSKQAKTFLILAWACLIIGLVCGEGWIWAHAHHWHKESFAYMNVVIGTMLGIPFSAILALAYLDQREEDMKYRKKSAPKRKIG